MKEKKFYTVEITRVEYYSSRVLVAAESEEEARRQVEKEWQENDYLYEKTTDSFDDATTSFENITAVKDEDLGLEKCRCIFSETVYDMQK